MFKLILFNSVSVLFLFLFISTETQAKNLKSYENLYTEGIKAYVGDDWISCINKMENAIREYHWWKENVLRCRKLCDEDVPELGTNSSFKSLDSKDVIFAQAILSTFCIVRCRESTFQNLVNFIPSVESEKAFLERKPYDYLQLCYFKEGRVEDAANAAQTVLRKQPDHKVMKDNLWFYIQEGLLNETSIIDLEMKSHEQSYYNAIEAYGAENFKEAVSIFENGLEIFWNALNDCRVLCENPLNGGWYTDFVSIIANAYTFTLRCKRLCYAQLSEFIDEENGNRDYVLNVFHFLQVAYHKMDNLSMACEAIETSLYLDPKNSVYNRNKQFLHTLSDIKLEDFRPRDDVRRYHDREQGEKKLLFSIERKFVTLKEKDFNLTHSKLESPNEDNEVDINLTNKITLSETDTKILSSTDSKIGGLSSNETAMGSHIFLSANGNELMGDSRFVADGFLTENDCNEMISLAKQGSVEGDGYKNSENPHTSFETFQGINLSRISLLVHAGLVNISILQNILTISDNAKSYLESHFNLTNSLYFSFTHLVCREARVGIQESRHISNLSHDIHADNCILQANGDCFKGPPAYTFRDYSAVLYLNDDFAGGEFMFTKDISGQTYESMVKPKCGRLVGFTAGPEDSHGVRGVVSGFRCALPMWFTFNKAYREVERDLAKQMVEKLVNGNERVKDEF